MAKLCACGCGETLATGSRGRMWNFKRNHDKRLQPPYFEVTESGCWRWLHGTNGRYALAGGGPAHRLFYELRFGKVDERLDVDHLCRNKLCVNPSHLEPVTRFTNTIRGKAAKLSPEKVVAIRGRLHANEPTRDIARDYCVSADTIRAIRNRESWILEG